jgi:NAD(P)-dependent dehydrogenase (short-subunit alcohol dehydrogenase family)
VAGLPNIAPLPDRFDLAGKLALIIGGSNGIGREIALGLQGSGALTLIIGKTALRVSETIAALRKLGGEAHGYQADVCDIAGLESLLDRILDEHGPIDVLVNSHGTTVLKPAEDFTLQDYQRIMDTNLTSVFFATTKVARQMLARREGSIINITSIAAQIGFPLSSVYDASKHGLLGLTRTFATEWAGRGVRVNAIAPGVILTALNRDIMSVERKDGFLRRTPMRRFGELQDIVGAALYLASSASAYVTGTTITIDGGYTAAAL